MWRNKNTYPENLSRIILTLTCSPIWNQRLRMKFSSIQGSSSPILQGERAMIRNKPQRPSTASGIMYVPEGGLSFVALLRNSGSSGLTRSRALECSGGRIRLASHGGIRSSSSDWGSCSGISRRVLVLEGIEVLEGHFDLTFEE